MACPDRLDRALSLLLPPAFWLGVWQLGAWLVELHVEGRGNELLLPYPATVLLALFRLARSPEFWWTALASLARIAAGMAGGAVLGGLLAALTCTSPWCRRLFAPVIRIVRATPVVSFMDSKSFAMTAGTFPATCSTPLLPPSPPIIVILSI